MAMSSGVFGPFVFLFMVFGHFTGQALAEDTCLLQTRGPVNQGKGLYFLRIQKTGGTTFGEKIMSKFCSPAKRCKGFLHHDWDMVQKELQKTGESPTVTLLRDPVERTMSEFFFMRTKDGLACTWQGQWNFRNDTWHRLVQDHKVDTDTALHTYLHGYAKNPSRNRQALYLLGFTDNGTEPGGVYDWDASHQELLQRAKDHLEKLTVFGLTDCYKSSMRLISRRLGWPEDKVVEMAGQVHARRARKSENAAMLQLYQADPPGRASSGISLASSSNPEGRWRQFLAPDMARFIEERNAVDVELYRFARQRFHELAGPACD